MYVQDRSGLFVGSSSRLQVNFQGEFFIAGRLGDLQQSLTYQDWLVGEMMGGVGRRFLPEIPKATSLLEVIYLDLFSDFKPGNSERVTRCDSKWPKLDPLVGRWPTTFETVTEPSWRGHWAIPKRSPADLPRSNEDSKRMSIGGTVHV